MTNMEQLTGKGGPFEVCQLEANGYSYRGYAEVFPSLRYLYDFAAQFGDRDLIVDGDIRLSYSDVFSLGQRFSTVLVERYGVKPGDRIAIAMRNRPEWIISFIAISAIGCIPVPLNSWGKGEELSYCLKDSGAIIMVGDAARIDRVMSYSETSRCIFISAGVDQEIEGVVRYEQLIEGMSDSGDWPLPAPAPDADALIIYTSGTTGRPKGVVSTQKALGHAMKNLGLSGAVVGMSIQRMLVAAGVDLATLPKDVQPAQLLVMPLFHLAGCQATFLNALQMGGRLVLMQKWDVDEALRLAEKERLSSLNGVPAMMWDVVNHPNRDKYDLSSVVSVGIGGAAETPEGILRLISSFPASVAGTGYGLTESGGVIAIISGDDLRQRPHSVGRPLPSVEVRIVDEAGHDVAQGKSGEILIKGAAAMSGYWNLEEETAEVLRDGWLYSGDIGCQDEEGFLSITGRAKDIVICGGENIACAEIEMTLQEHPAVNEVAALGLPDDRMGEILVVVVVPAKGADVSEQDIKDHVAAHLAHYKVPKKVFFTNKSLPRTALGKLLKKDVREQLNLTG